MTPILLPSLFCAMYFADSAPCAGSEKQTRNALSALMQSCAVPEGVSKKMWSFSASAATAIVHPLVVGPTRNCIPQSINVL